MKTLLFPCLLTLLTSGIFAADFNSSMANIMKSMKAYTLEMVALMPEEKLDYKPVAAVRSFREQVAHMIEVNRFILGFQLKGDGKGDPMKAIAEAEIPKDAQSKEALMKALSQQFDDAIAFFESANNNQHDKTYTFGTPDSPITTDYFAVAMLLRDHFSHHRSQLIVYLRLNDIEPARFRGF